MDCVYNEGRSEGSGTDRRFCIKSQINLTNGFGFFWNTVPYRKGRFLGFRTIESESGWGPFKTRHREDIETYEQIHPCEDCPHKTLKGAKAR